jgi:hypothetical protein
MDVTGDMPHPFRIMTTVPDEMISLGPDGDWAAWVGVDCAEVDGRESVVLVSIAVTALDPARGRAAGEVLAAAVRERHPAGAGIVAEFRTASGNPGVRVQGEVTRQVNGRPVTTGQAQALVVFPGAGALGVVSGVCPDLSDLERAGSLVAIIATRMTVTAATAAA